MQPATSVTNRYQILACRSLSWRAEAPMPTASEAGTPPPQPYPQEGKAGPPPAAVMKAPPPEPAPMQGPQGGVPVTNKAPPPPGGPPYPQLTLKAPPPPYPEASRVRRSPSQTLRELEHLLSRPTAASSGARPVMPVPHVLTIINKAPPPYPPRNAQAEEELHPEAPPPYPPQGKAGGFWCYSFRDAVWERVGAPGATASATPSGSGSAHRVLQLPGRGNRRLPSSSTRTWLSGSAQLAVTPSTVEVQHVQHEDILALLEAQDTQPLDTLTETYEGDWQQQPADPCDAPPWTCPIHAMSPDVLLEAQPPVFVAGFPCRPFSPVADAVPPADL